MIFEQPGPGIDSRICCRPVTAFILQTMTNHITPVLAANFHSSGPKKTIPVCGVDLYASFQPYASYHSYGIGAKDCSYKGSQALPFFMDRFGPKWTEYTTTAHEQMPGHHLEVSDFR